MSIASDLQKMETELAAAATEVTEIDITTPVPLGAVVNFTLPDGDLHTEYVVVGTQGEKNGQEVYDLLYGNDKRWCYRHQIVEITGQLTEQELIDIAGDSLASREGLPYDTPIHVVQRHFRERMRISRAKLAQETGLSLSVIWRSEQPQRTITSVQATKIWDTLVGIEGES